MTSFNTRRKTLDDKGSGCLTNAPFALAMFVGRIIKNYAGRPTLGREQTDKSLDQNTFPFRDKKSSAIMLAAGR